MRLSAIQKEVVLRHRPGSSLVRLDDSWVVVWRAAERAPADRWVGQVLHRVTSDSPPVVIWAGSVCFARTRRLLLAELQRELF